MIEFDVPPIRNVLPTLMRGLKIDKLPKPRALKSADEKFLRTRTNAEVFTPSHVVKFMVDALDDTEIFWQAYVEKTWLEIACGEAPFITNRYDAESGELIPAELRVGVLDRKLRRIPADVDKFIWANRAVQSVYGYELQADSLLIARANILLTVAEFVGDCSDDELKEFAEVISRNFWQYDALKPPPVQMSLFDDATDWNTGNGIFLGGSDMKKFDLVIGNPPYQDETSGDNKTFAPPVYDKFMEEAHKVGKQVELITPARFLFNQGGTTKDFNQRMLSDPHLKVIDYAPDARKYFKGVDIEGGVAITLRDEDKNFGAIGTLIPFDELRSICEKVILRSDFVAFGKIISGRTPYLFTDKFHEENPNAVTKLSDGHPYDISSNAFTVLPEIFLKEKSSEDCLRVLGRLNSERAYCWIRKDFVRGRIEEYISKWKVFISKANGGASGKLNDKEAARIISNPVIGEPSDISTDTFLVVGAFDTQAEADACLTYIKSKFARAMLGALKVTPVNPKATWAKVPMQDFNPATSDIDWSGDIDAQLYKKYELDDAEINFIETHVREMI